MGVIKKQASGHIAVSYVGSAIAFFATLFVYPLELGAYGLAQTLSMTALFLMPFFTLGTYAAVVKFFPEIQQKAQEGSYLSYMLLITTAAMALVIGSVYLVGDTLYDWLDALGFDINLIKQNSWPLLLITLFVIYGRVLTLHASNYDKTGVPAIYNLLLPKLVLPVLIYLLFIGVISLTLLTWLWTATFGITVLALMIYLRRIGGLDLGMDWEGFKLPFLRRLAVYSGYTGLSMMGSVLTNRLDAIMVILLMGEEQNGVYLIAMFITTVMQIPTTAVWQIVSPQIAKAWDQNDLAHISKLYKRSSTNLYVSGVVVYFVFLGCIDSVFQLTAKYETLVSGIIVFALLGLARLFDMLMSINTQILIYSRSYRYNTIFIVVLGLINIALNYILINNYGLMGAALATLISAGVYNVLKSVFLYMRYRLSPFSNNFPKMLAFTAAIGLCYYFFPKLTHPVLHIAIYSGAMGLLGMALLYLMKIDTDFIPYFTSQIVKRLPNWGKSDKP